MLVMAARNQPALVKLGSEDGYKRSYQRMLTRRHQHRPLHLTSLSTAEWAGQFNNSRPAACQAGESLYVSTLLRRDADLCRPGLHAPPELPDTHTNQIGGDDWIERDPQEADPPLATAIGHMVGR